MDEQTERLQTLLILGIVFIALAVVLFINLNKVHTQQAKVQKLRAVAQILPTMSPEERAAWDVDPDNPLNEAKNKEARDKISPERVAAIRASLSKKT